MKLAVICFVVAVYGVIVICGTEFSVLQFTANLKNIRSKKPWITSSIIVSFWIILCFTVILLQIYHRKSKKIVCWIGLGSVLGIAVGIACALISISFFVNILDTIEKDVSVFPGEQIIWTVQPPDVTHHQNFKMRDTSDANQQIKTCLEAVLTKDYQFKLTFACYFADDTMTTPFAHLYKTDLFSMIPELNITLFKTTLDQYRNYIFLLSNVTNEMKVRLGDEAQRTKQQISDFYSGLLELSARFNLKLFDNSLETLTFVVQNLQSLQFAAWGCLVSGPAFWFLCLLSMSILSCCHCL
jgi:hypothetical protein